MRPPSVELFEEGQNCPACKDGRLATQEKKFEYMCCVCWKTFEKHCPNYFDKRFCRGCQFYRTCCKRLNAKLADDPTLGATDA